MYDWNPTLSEQFDCLVRLTQGKRIEIEDHVWDPQTPGVVLYLYRGKPIQMEMFKAALEAGRIIAMRKAWGSFC